MSMRRAYACGFAVTVLGGGLGASLAAWAEGAEEVIHGCHSNHTGALRIVAAGERCRPQETAIEWNRQGPAGPAGQAGPTGAQGPAGPEGPPGGLAGREIVTLAFTVPRSTVDFTYVATARCPTGKVVIGGGYEIDQAGVNEFRESHPEVDQPDLEGWSVGVGPDDDVDVDGVVYAMCADP